MDKGNNPMNALVGYRTYIIAAGAVVGAVVAFLTGEITLVEAVQTAIIGAGFGTLRLGLANK